jgi:hypothetical protein
MHVLHSLIADMFLVRSFGITQHNNNITVQRLTGSTAYLQMNCLNETYVMRSFRNTSLCIWAKDLETKGDCNDIQCKDTTSTR